MSEILVDNLTGKTSAGSITVYGEGGTVTQSLQQGLAKCSIKFAGGSATATEDLTGVSYSLNVASLVDVSTGKYKINISNDMTDGDYAITASVSLAGSTSDFLGFIDSSTNTPAAGSFGVLAVRAAFYDPNIFCVLIHGDLA